MRKEYKFLIADKTETSGIEARISWFTDAGWELVYAGVTGNPYNGLRAYAVMEKEKKEKNGNESNAG